MNTRGREALRLLSLLYVEDDADTREELAAMLAPWVGALHVADNGQTGLESFAATKPDIVITDIQMPHMSGLAMSAEIRRLVPEQAIVVLSAYNDSEYLFRSIEMGIDHYVLKPVNVDRLLDKLADMGGAVVAAREHRRTLLLLSQYKHLVDQSAIVCKLDPTGKIVYVNEKLCEISGFSEADLVGRDLADLREGHLRGIGWEEACAGRQWKGIVRNCRRNGETYMLESSLVPIFGENAELAEIICLDVDITPILRAKQELVVAKEAAESANRAKSAFLANISHEIRTPMTAIIGMSDLIRLEPLSPRQLDRLGKLQDASNRLLGIVTDVLELSSLEAGTVTLDVSAVDLKGITNAVVDRMTPIAKAKGLQIVQSVESLDARLLGDSGRVRQALLQYVGNAIKFSERGQITIRICAQDDRSDRVLMRFEVEDQGIGISDEVIARLFRNFEQADGSMTRQYGGSGLGLAIVKRSAALMGGDAGVVSQPGRGSVFWFSAVFKKGVDPLDETAG